MGLMTGNAGNHAPPVEGEEPWHTACRPHIDGVGEPVLLLMTGSAEYSYVSSERCPAIPSRGPLEMTGKTPSLEVVVTPEGPCRPHQGRNRPSCRPSAVNPGGMATFTPRRLLGRDPGPTTALPYNGALCQLVRRRGSVQAGWFHTSLAITIAILCNAARKKPSSPLAKALDPTGRADLRRVKEQHHNKYTTGRPQHSPFHASTCTPLHYLRQGPWAHLFEVLTPRSRDSVRRTSLSSTPSLCRRTWRRPSGRGPSPLVPRVSRISSDTFFTS